MQGHLVVVVVIHTLDDVDLAVMRPIGAHRPEGRPHSTAVRHALDVENDEAGRVGVLGGNPDTNEMPSHVRLRMPDSPIS